MYKVRFHLAHGPNYRSWQVKEGRGVSFHDPAGVRLRMWSCRLRNRRQIAEAIHAGSGKSVCAWIECAVLEVAPPSPVEGTRLSYNPRIRPCWVLDGGEVDDMTFPLLETCGAEVLVPR